MKKIIGLLFLTSVLMLVGCKKSKIRKNLDGMWTLSGLYFDGDNEVTSDYRYSLEFKNVEKEGGDIFMHSVDDVTGDTYLVPGTFTLSKDHEKMDVNLTDGSYLQHWDVSLTLDESTLTLNGTYDDNVGSPQGSIVVNGFK